ncbi:hypothetical protein EV426DRAFT_169285 [Tirmania nivea]|nr:hypothetical protein EV426DRAFT_169285 [Tirmania nivea]
MGVKNTAIIQPHASIPSQETSHGYSTPVQPSSPPDPRPSPSPPALSDRPRPPPVDSRLSVDVKTLIRFFNSRSTSPAPKPPLATGQPVFNLNGKVKNLVREFSKSTLSLPDPRLPRPFGQVKKIARAIRSEPAFDQLQNGGGAAGNGVSQGSGGSGQVSEEGSNTGYVTSIQHTDSEDQPNQQHQEAAEATVELVQDVTQAVSRHKRPRYSEQSPDRKRAESIQSVTTSTTSHSEESRIKQWKRQISATPIRLNDILSKIDSLVAASQEQNRPNPIDSVVMSARNSELRKSKSMGLALSGIGRFESVLSPLGLETVDEQLVSRTSNKSTEPPPLKIVKVRKSEYANNPGLNTFGYYKEPTLALPKVPFLAPSAQSFVEPQEFAQSSQAPSISDSVSIRPEQSVSHRQSSGCLSRSSWQNRQIKAGPKRGETGSQASPSMDLVTPSIMLEQTAERADTKDKSYGAPGGLAVPSPPRLPTTRAYRTLPNKGAPRMRIYYDTEWVNHGHQALQKNMGQTDGDVHSAIDTVDGFPPSPTSWCTSTPLEDSLSVAETTSLLHSPLSPLRAPFKSYFMSPGDTAGKYHSLPRRKIELIRPLPHPFSVEQIGLQKFNPRFSTFTKQESFSDASFVTIDQEALSLRSEVGPKSLTEAKDPRSAYKSPIQRIIALEDATSRAVGLMSPSYVAAGSLSRALGRANSVDMENKRYSRRR